MQQLDFTCKIFTNVMAIKYQLQFALFNGSYYNEKKEGLVSHGEIKNFILTLQYLQNLQSVLQKIEVC